MIPFLKNRNVNNRAKQTCLRLSAVLSAQAGATHRQKGVTLIEMAVVISIIFFLAAVSIVEFGSMDDKARRNSSLVAAKALGDSIRMYKQDKRKYTCNLDDLMPYTNLTTLRNSFLSVTVFTNDPTAPDCTMASSTYYIRISATLKNVVPNYLVQYHVVPANAPDCTSNGAAFYPCAAKW